MNPNNAFPTPTPEEEATLRALDSLDNIVVDKTNTPAPRPVRSPERVAPRPVHPPHEKATPAPHPAPKVVEPVKPVTIEAPQKPAAKPVVAPVEPPKPAATPVPQKPKRSADDPTGIKAEIESAPSRPLYDFFAAQNKHFKNNKGLILAILTVIIVAVGGYFAFQYYSA